MQSSTHLKQAHDACSLGCAAGSRRGTDRIAFFGGNVLGAGLPFSIASDVATTTLLNSAPRVYFRAPFNQVSSHLAFLQSVGGNWSRSSSAPTSVP